MMPPKTRIVIGAYLQQKGMCPYCRRPVTVKNATWEHIIPRAWGGHTLNLNVILACEPCNNAKSAIESLISNGFSKDLDFGSQAALFILRCMKMNRSRNRKVKLPKDTYLHMAIQMQAVAEDRLRCGRVTIPELPGDLQGAFI